MSTYSTRPSPPFPANEYRDKKRKGNDGNMYISVANKTGVYSWQKVKVAKRVNRPSPSLPAKEHCGKTRKGNDGNMYKSVANKNEVYSWKKVVKGGWGDYYYDKCKGEGKTCYKLNGDNKHMEGLPSLDLNSTQAYVDYYIKNFSSDTVYLNITWDNVAFIDLLHETVSVMDEDDKNEYNMNVKPFKGKLGGLILRATPLKNQNKGTYNNHQLLKLFEYGNCFRFKLGELDIVLILLSIIERLNL